MFTNTSMSSSMLIGSDVAPINRIYLNFGDGNLVLAVTVYHLHEMVQYVICKVKSLKYETRRWYKTQRICNSKVEL